ncbi:MAG: hypothetical protein WCH31_08405 [Actinomycetes bacterium]
MTNTPTTRRPRAALLVLAATLAVCSLGVGTGSAAVSKTLHGLVGPDTTITLTFDDGSSVSTLPAGTYTLVVRDLASDHNFHVFGSGVDQSTSIDDVGTSTFTITLRDNATYIFQCDPHLDFMIGHFQTGNGAASADSALAGGPSGATSSSSSTSNGYSGSASSKTKASAASSLVGTLHGTVGASGKLGLALNGKSVSVLPAGKYKIIVADTTSKRGFSVGPASGAATAVSSTAFTGSRTVTVTLKTGQWKFYSPSDAAGTTSLFRVIGS